MPDYKDLLTFPCEFHLKVMGKATPEFEADVIAILRRHIPNLGEGAISRRSSAQANYLALNISFTARDRAQMDALYADLHACPNVVMAL